MHITFTTDDVVSTLADGGSVVTMVGTLENGERVRVGIEHRCAEAILSAVLGEDWDEVDAEIEAWQILGRVA